MNEFYIREIAITESLIMSIDYKFRGWVQSSVLYIVRNQEKKKSVLEIFLAFIS